MRTLELSPRLLSVAGLVPKESRLADVGTDHAYLPAWLILRGVIPGAIATDLRKGPLERAKATAEKYGLTDVMDFRLCNGLAGVSPDEADAVAIAGMGGETIAEILSAAPWLQTGGKTLLLQPMSAQPELRLWLQRHGYTIRQELLSKEGETIYVAFQVYAGTMEPLTPGEQWAGRQHQDMDAPLRGLYLDRLTAQTRRALDGLSRSSRSSDQVRLTEMKAVYQDLLRLSEEWSTWQQ